MRTINDKTYYATCVFCSTKQELQSAIDDGWEPCYWIGNNEQDGPVCPNCVLEKLSQADFPGERELIHQPIIIPVIIPTEEELITRIVWK